jgi:hypothetical protein
MILGTGIPISILLNLEILSSEQRHEAPMNILTQDEIDTLANKNIQDHQVHGDLRCTRTVVLPDNIESNDCQLAAHGQNFVVGDMGNIQYWRGETEVFTSLKEEEEGTDGLMLKDNIIYASSIHNRNIIRFDTGFNNLPPFGEGILSVPRGMSIGTDGLLYICDTALEGVHRFTLDGVYEGTIPTDMHQPKRVVAKGSSIYVLTDEPYVKVYHTNGTFDRNIGEGRLENPTSLAVSNGYHLFVLDDNEIIEFNKMDNYCNSIEDIDAVKAITIDGEFPLLVVAGDGDGHDIVMFLE